MYVCVGGGGGVGGGGDVCVYRCVQESYVLLMYTSATECSSVQFQVVSTRSGKPIYAPSSLCLSEVSPALPLKRFPTFV